MQPEELNQVQHLPRRELVCAMVSDPPPGGITIFSRPELDLTPGFTKNFNFSLN